MEAAELSDESGSLSGFYMFFTTLLPGHDNPGDTLGYNRYQVAILMETR